MPVAEPDRSVFVSDRHKPLEGKKVVVKYGGSAIVMPELKKDFAKKVVFLQQIGANPVVVHGGGPQISRQMKRLGKKARFVDGLRVTDHDTMVIVQHVLDDINKEIVKLICSFGGVAVGLAGRKGNLLWAKPCEPDLERTGEVKDVNAALLKKLINDSVIPVISSVGIGEDGGCYNINADMAAGEIAAAIKSDLLVFLTDVPGILDNNGRAFSTLTCMQVEELVERGVIGGGMLPKVRAALVGLRKGVVSVNICLGTQPATLFCKKFLATGTIGTRIILDGNTN